MVGSFADTRSAVQRATVLVTSLVLVGVLVYSGLVKLRSPGEAASFIASIAHTWPQPAVVSAVQAIAVAEILLALWLCSGRAEQSCRAALASIFVVFAVIHAFAAAEHGPDAPACGCMGASQLASSLTPFHWMGLNALLASAAALPVVKYGRADAVEEPG